LLRLMTLSRRIVAEGLGTALLLAAVVGSGIMGERLAGGNVAIALLANTLATGAMLVTLIFTFGPISGAHFNPAVTLADAWPGGFSWRRVPAYIAAQVAGAFIGVGAAHLMFGLPVVQISQHVRAGGSQLLRVHRHVRPALRHLGLRAPPLGSRAGRSRPLHHRRLLVHGVYIFR
jgi:glycerol uptake facilitator-like aquaporin